MTGLMHKKMIQHRLLLMISFLAALAPDILMSILSVSFISAESNAFSLKRMFEMLTSDLFIFRFVTIIMVYITLGMYHTSILMIDESKKWSYFISSTPVGKKGQVYSNYVTIFMMCGLTFMGFMIVETVFAAIAAAADAAYTPLLPVYVYIFYLQLFLRAVELPFLFRFNTKSGTIIRSIALILFLIVVIGYFLFGPLPTDAENLIESIVNIIEKFISGEYNETLSLIFSILPFVSLGAYYLSYKLSVKFYQKGVETYEK